MLSPYLRNFVCLNLSCTIRETHDSIDNAPPCREHRFRTIVDLQLLHPQSEEAAELMELMRAGGVSIADRSKVRLLIGATGGGAEVWAWMRRQSRSRRAALADPDGRPRQLQGSAGSELSMDTVLPSASPQSSTILGRHAMCALLRC